MNRTEPKYSIFYHSTTVGVKLVKLGKQNKVYD